MDYLLLVSFLIFVWFPVVRNCPELCTCLDDTSLDFIINCSGSDLKEVPAFDRKVRILDLSWNGFTHFQNIHLYQNIQRLYLNGNQIKELHFPRLANLEDVDLSNNLFVDLDNITINITQLKTLNLSYNKIKEAVELNSKTLQKLDLSHCNIIYLRYNLIDSLPNLIELNLSQNPIKIIDELYSKNLKFLNLRGINIHFLRGSHLEDLEALEVLDLSRNRNFASMVHGGFITNTNLKIIDLSYGDILFLGLDNLPKIQNLIINNNRIEQINKFVFTNNNNLIYIDLSCNQIKNISRYAFENLQKLKQINLSGNKINELTWTNDVTAEYINLSNNNLSILNNLKFKNVKILDLSKNKINKIYQLQENTNKIQILNLSYNPIKILEKLFSLTLIELRLDNCEILSIENTTFTGLPNLKILNLSGNKLKYLNYKYIFKLNLNLRTVNLQNNPWNCDCEVLEFKYFYNYLIQGNLSKKEELICAPEVNYTWHSKCQGVWSNNQIVVYSGNSFYYVLFIVFSLLIILFVGFSWRYFKNTDGSSQIEFEDRTDFNSPRRSPTPSYQRRREGAMYTFSAPPPSYEEVVGLQQQETASDQSGNVVVVVVNNNNRPQGRTH